MVRSFVDGSIGQSILVVANWSAGRPVHHAGPNRWHGQHLQSFLKAAGITGRYAILRVLPVDTLTRQSGGGSRGSRQRTGAGAVCRSDQASPTTGVVVRRPARRTSACPRHAGGDTLSVSMKSRYCRPGVDAPSWQAALTRAISRTLIYRRQIHQPDVLVRRRTRTDSASRSAVRHAALAGLERQPWSPGQARRDAVVRLQRGHHACVGRGAARAAAFSVRGRRRPRS